MDKFRVDSSEIIERVAADAEAKGLSEDAVRLYDLAKVTGTVLKIVLSGTVPVFTSGSLQKHDNVLRTLNKLLSQVSAGSSLQDCFACRFYYRFCRPRPVVVNQLEIVSSH